MPYPPECWDCRHACAMPDCITMFKLTCYGMPSGGELITEIKEGEECSSADRALAARGPGSDPQPCIN